MLWDLIEGKRLYSLDAGDIIYGLCFSPNRYWLCAATESCVKIWDLESKSIVDQLPSGVPRRLARSPNNRTARPSNGLRTVLRSTLATRTTLSASGPSALSALA